MHSNDFRDCNGVVSNQQITNYHHKLEDPSIERIVDEMSRASLYIGYDSGYAMIANAMKVPYVYLSGACPPIACCGDTCIYALEVCPHCCKDSCEKMCLSHAPNKNDEIRKAIGL
jgi:ADP-heptose:LPS heptosyltransferase